MLHEAEDYGDWKLPDRTNMLVAQAILKQATRRCNLLCCPVGSTSPFVHSIIISRVTSSMCRYGHKSWTISLMCSCQRILHLLHQHQRIHQSFHRLQNCLTMSSRGSPASASASTRNASSPSSNSSSPTRKHSAFHEARTKYDNCKENITQALSFINEICGELDRATAYCKAHHSGTNGVIQKFEGEITRIKSCAGVSQTLLEEAEGGLMEAFDPGDYGNAFDTGVCGLEKLLHGLEKSEAEGTSN